MNIEYFAFELTIMIHFFFQVKKCHRQHTCIFIESYRFFLFANCLNNQQMNVYKKKWIRSVLIFLIINQFQQKHDVLNRTLLRATCTLIKHNVLPNARSIMIDNNQFISGTQSVLLIQ